jgi:hypothetical protein
LLATFPGLIVLDILFVVGGGTHGRVNIRGWWIEDECLFN